MYITVLFFFLNSQRVQVGFTENLNKTCIIQALLIENFRTPEIAIYYFFSSTQSS